MPRVEHDYTHVSGLREHLAARCRVIIGKLEHATKCELYDFRPELDRQRDRLIDIKTGRDVLVYVHELGDFAPPRAEREHVYTLQGDRLVTARYERVNLD